MRCSMTVEIKITHDGKMSNIDAIHATHTALILGAWKKDSSKNFWMRSSLGYDAIRVEVTDLNPDDKTHDRQFEVKLIEDK